MKYSTSDIDLKNHEWFQNDINSRSLKTIRLEYGQIRGLHPCQINFTQYQLLLVKTVLANPLY